VEAFRLALESLQIQPEELALDAADPQVRATLRRSLDSESPRQLRYALELMRGVSDPEAVLRLEQLLTHNDGEIRAGALRVLAHDATVHTRVDAGALLEDSDSRVRREAAVLLARRGLGQQLQASRHEQRAVLRTLLADERPSVRAAALGAMADLDHADLLDPKRAAAVLELRGGDAEWVRYELARALGSAPRSPEVQELLGILARDASPRVVKRAIRSAGRHTDPALVSELSERLGDRSSRGPAIEALIACGPSAVARLAPELRGSRSTQEKLSVVRVLSRIEDQTAVDGLSAALPDSSGGLRHALLRALNRLRVRGSALAFPPTLTRDELQQEVRYHRALTRLVKLQPEAQGPADKLLLRALREKRDDSLELVFRLLALLYSPKDMHNAFAAVRSRHPRAKANAIEFLDNVLAPRDKRQVLPLVEAPGRSGLPNSKRRSVRAGEAKPGLAELISGRDAWLRACAVFCGSGDAALRGPIEDALRDPEAIVREAAAFALSHPSPPC
jgi:HEAT repeat protein